MKKIVLILITLILATGMVFAAEPETSTVKITGTIAPTVPSIDGNPEIGGDPSGLWIHGYIVKNPDQNKPSVYSIDNNNTALGATNAEIPVDIDHKNETEGNVDSLRLVFGATSNVSPTTENNAAVDIKVTNSGWTLKGATKTDPVNTLTLKTVTDTTETKEATFAETSTVSDAKMTWKVLTEGNENIGLSVDASAGTRNTTPQLIGWTDITWGVAEGKTPTAGDYEAIITITVSAGQ